MTTIQLPEWPWQLVRGLARDRGVRVWPVGGVVRDALLGRPIHDWDFAVDRGALGLAKAVADALGGAYFVLDGERATGRVIVTARDGVPNDLDFAALRCSSLQGDLLIRDFSVNAMAIDGEGALVDPTGGEDDLECERLRATSEHVFRQDPIRLLRAVRLESELGFEIGPRTADWVRRDAGQLSLSSPERVRDELVRIVALERASVPLMRLDALELLPQTVPELVPLKGMTQSPPHSFDVWRHTLHVVDGMQAVTSAVQGGGVKTDAVMDVVTDALGELSTVFDRTSGAISGHLAVEVSSGRDRALTLKLAALFHDAGKAETRSQDEEGRAHFHGHESVGASLAVERMRALRFSRDEVERVRLIVKSHLRPANLARSGRITARAVYRYFRATGDAGIDVVLLCLADRLPPWGSAGHVKGWRQQLEAARVLVTHYFERREETIAPPPLITGRDLMTSLEMEPGPQMGHVLDAIQEAQAAGEVRTRDEALALALAMQTGQPMTPATDPAHPRPDTPPA